MVLSKSTLSGIIVAVVVVVIAVIIVSLYVTNILIPRYTCDKGVCKSNYKGKFKEKKCNCSQQLFLSRSVIRKSAQNKDANVVNGVTILMLGYIDTSQYRAGDTMSWNIDAKAATGGSNKICVGGAIVNKTAFFGILDSPTVDTDGVWSGGFSWNDGDNSTRGGQWPWETGVFVHDFWGSLPDKNSVETRFLRDMLNDDSVFLLGNKSDMTNPTSSYAGGPVGDKTSRCTSSTATAKVILDSSSAVLPADGIGHNAYLAFLWITHTTSDDITVSITTNTVSFTSK